MESVFWIPGINGGALYREGTLGRRKGGLWLKRGMVNFLWCVVSWWGVGGFLGKRSKFVTAAVEYVCFVEGKKGDAKLWGTTSLCTGQSWSFGVICGCSAVCSWLLYT